jgi:cell division protein FtsB
MAKKKNASYLLALRYLGNRYVLMTVGFLVWMTFFDKNDFLTTYSYRSTLEDLRTQKADYENEISRNKAYLDQLHTDTANLEKFAREKYLMKKENEDIFVVVEEK